MITYIYFQHNSQEFRQFQAKHASEAHDTMSRKFGLDWREQYELCALTYI